jgi:serine/threonine protein kinase
MFLSGLSRSMSGQEGGKLYGEGGYGCIFIPPLTCADGAETLPSNSTVKATEKIDKLMEKDDAKIEFDVAKRIQQIPLWETYYLVPKTMCTPAIKAKQTETEIGECSLLSEKDIRAFRLLRMDYGGLPLSQYSMNFHKFPFINFAKHLLEGVALMSLFGIAHMDLHTGNILVNDQNVPHIIDFNLAVDVQDQTDLEGRISHTYKLNLMQETPDNLLVNAYARRVIDKDTSVPSSETLVEEMISDKKILRTMRTVLGITADEQREGMMEFLAGSKSAQTGDMVLWFNAHWRKNDSWACAANLVTLISRMSLWNSFAEGEFSHHSTKLLAVLKKMSHTNPNKRFDAVQALAELDPENAIIKTYAGPWLEKVGRF